MTGTNVKGINSLMNYASARPSGNAADSLSGNFTDAFSKASGQSGMQDMTLQNDRITSGSSQLKVNHTDKKGLDGSNTVKENNKTDKLQNADESGKVEEAVQKAGEELVEEVAKELGISVDEVRKAMETLGLTMADLLNVNNMTQLVLTLQGADMISLMTDEGLYNSLQNLLGVVNETVNALQTEFGITEEELGAILEQVKAAEEVPEEDVNKNTISKEEPVQKTDGQEDYTVTVEENGETVEVSVEVNGSGKTESQEVTTEKVQTPEQEKSVNTVSEGETPKKDSSSHSDNTQSNMLLENLLTRENVVRTEAVFENAMAGRTANTQDIANQIMDYMRIQVKADMTQMEIQLHPASLGTVNINISSKDGVITAQFLTQNELVKAAIEGQIVQLKSSFEEQGLKVQAVEVTVESHQFERNLSGEGNGQEQAQDGKKKGVRKINLNELNADEETELDQTEQIAVAMMTADGNTVDYTA